MAAGIGGTTIAMGTSARAATVGGRINEYMEEFGTVIDVVEAGADNTGKESVTPVLQDLVDDDTLLVFPPGRYYMDEQVRFTDFENFGLAGNDATLVPANYHDFDGPQYRLFRMGVYYAPGDGLVFDGFTVDQTAPDTGIRVIDAVVDDGLEVRDVTIQGKHTSGTWGPGRFVVSDPSGSGIVERFESPDGAEWVSETPNAGNLWRGPSGMIANMNEGTLRFKDCVLGGFPDNGLYASGGSGQIVVDGGRYENSNAPSIRLGGTNSVIRGATVRIDEMPYGFDGQRGIRLERGENLRIEDTDVEVLTSNGETTPIEVLNTCGESWIENVHVTVDTDVPNDAIQISSGAGYTTIVKSGIVLDTPGGFGIHLDGVDDSPGANIEYVNIVGNAGDEAARAAIRCDRDNTRIAATNVDQPGGTHRRAVVNTGNDVVIYKGDYLASEYPIIDLGTGTLVNEIYARSYADYEAICLYDESADVYLKNNTLRGGVKDNGCEGLKMVGNEF